MLARLWWKDARQFLPIWLTLVGAAMGIQWLILQIMESEAKVETRPSMIVAAVGWTALYAFAVSAAAFAGERENNTLLFLDMIPVSRRVIWTSKVSFAVVSTLVLAMVLGLIAGFSSHRVPFGDAPIDFRIAGGREVSDSAVGAVWIVVVTGAFLVEALGWGLFWSSALKNAMLAAVLAMLSTAFDLALIQPHLYHLDQPLYQQWPFQAIYLHTGVAGRLGIGLATAAASALIFTLGQRPRSIFGERRNRPLPGPWTFWGRRLTVMVEPRQADPIASRVPRFPEWPAVHVLFWQSIRESWSTYWRILAIGLGLPLVWVICMPHWSTPQTFLLWVNIPLTRCRRPECLRHGNPRPDLALSRASRGEAGGGLGREARGLGGVDAGSRGDDRGLDAAH